MKHGSSIKRLRDVAAGIKDGTVKYFLEHAGSSRHDRRKVKAQATRSERAGLKMRPKNWTRDKHTRRRLQKARRKQGRESRSG